MITITEFLLARVTEDEQQARDAIRDRWGRIHEDGHDWAGDLQSIDRDATAWQDAHAAKWWPARVLLECEAKRAIIRQHEAWPVLIEEEEPTCRIEPTADLAAVSYAMNRRIAWLTEREYIKHFGTAPPTAPMIRTLAAVYRDHPDYLEEWAAE